MADGGFSELTVRAPDGRSLEVVVTGPADGLPLVYHHGTPGCAALYGAMARAAEARGLRLVLYARPGYGNSAAMPGRVIADAAADVIAILDELDASQFVTMGWSGGGPHALACGQLLPGRCLAVACLAGPAPYDAAGLDWMAGMAPENVDEFAAAVAGEPEISKVLDTFVPAMRQLTEEQLAESLGDLASAADRAALHGELADYLVRLFRGSVATGTAGWRDDDLAFVRDWGFSPAADGQAAPVAIWQGDQDQMVPFAHGQWLAASIPAARTHLMAGAGHLSLPYDAIMDELLVLAAGRPG